MRSFRRFLVLLCLLACGSAQAQFTPAPCPDAELVTNPAAACSLRSSFTFQVFGSVTATTPAQACSVVAEQFKQASNVATTCTFRAVQSSCSCTEDGVNVIGTAKVIIDPASMEPACPAGHRELTGSSGIVLGPDGFRALMPFCVAPPGTPPVAGTPPTPPPETLPSTKPPAPVPGVCPVAPLSVMTGPIALQHENGHYAAVSDLDHTTAPVLAGLKCMQARSYGSTVMPVAAFRPAQYQHHLKQVWDTWHKLKNDVRPECKALRDAVRNEWLKHKLIREPVMSAAHAAGEAVDLIGLPPGSADHTASLCGMVRPDSAGSPLHFQPGKK